MCMFLAFIVCWQNAFSRDITTDWLGVKHQVTYLPQSAWVILKDPTVAKCPTDFIANLENKDLEVKVFKIRHITKAGIGSN